MLINLLAVNRIQLANLVSRGEHLGAFVEVTAYVQR